MPGNPSHADRSGAAVGAPALTPMTSAEFVAYLHGIGVALQAKEGKLQLTAPSGALTAELQAELRRRKPELLLLLEKSGAGEEQRVGPLTFAQQRLWLVERFSPGGAAYNIPQSWRVPGAIEEDVLRCAIDALAERHQSLRTRIEMRNGEAVQVVLRHVSIPLRFTDLSGEASVEERERRLSAMLVEEGRRPFSLDHAPLIRFHLFRLAPELHVVFYNVHHIVADQWSLSILKRDLSRLYSQALHLETPTLPAVPIQYFDVAVRERGDETKQLYERQMGYWRKRLQGAPTLLELPFSGPRPPEQGFAGTTLTLSIDAGLTQRLRQCASRSKHLSLPANVACVLGAALSLHGATRSVHWNADNGAQAAG